jgi:localization factor PodJL
MGYGNRWNLSDVEADARDAAFEAARASGLSVGEWVSQAIHDRAEETQHRSRDRRGPRGLRRQLGRGEPTSPLDDLNDRLERMARGQTDTEERAAYSTEQALGLMERAVRDNELKTARALDNMQRMLLEGQAAPGREPTAGVAAQRALDATALEGTLGRLLGKLETLERSVVQPKQGPPRDGEAMARLERQIATLASRLETAPGEAQRDNIQRIEGKLATILDVLRKPPAAAPEPSRVRPRMPVAQSLPARDLRAAVAEIAQRQRHLDRGDGGVDSEHLEALRAEIAGLTKRIEADSPGVLQERLREDLKEIGRTLETLAPRHQLATLERGIAMLTGKIDDLKDAGARGHDVSAAERVLGDLRQSIDRLREPESLRELAATVQALMQKVDAIGQRPMQAPALETLQRQIEQLAQVVGQPQDNGLQKLEARLAALDTKFDSLLRRPGDSGAAEAMQAALGGLKAQMQAADPARIVARIEERIEALARRIDTAQTPEAESGPDPVSLITERLDRIQSRLDAQVSGAVTVPGGDAQPLLSMLSGRMDRLDSLLSQRSEPSVADTSGLERMVSDLARRIDGIGGQPASEASFGELHGEVRRLSQRLEVLPDATPGLADIERKVSAVLAEVERTRLDAERFSADAARVAAETVSRSMNRAGVGENPAVGEELAQLREAQERAEQRTQETLEAVHDTLQRVVQRLASLETPAPTRVPPAPVAVDIPTRQAPRPEPVLDVAPAPLRTEPAARQPSLDMQPPSRSAAPAFVTPAASEPAAAGKGAVHLALEAARQAVSKRFSGSPAEASPPAQPANPHRLGRTEAPEAADASLFDTPLEPGSGRPQPGQVRRNPEPQIAAAPVASGDPKADFLASARRAAQAAAQQSQDALAQPKRSVGGAVAARVSDIKSAGLKKKHVLLLGLAALVVAVGATLQIMGALKSRSTSAEAERQRSSAIEQPFEQPRRQAAAPATTATVAGPRTETSAGETVQAQILPPKQGGRVTTLPPTPAAQPPAADPATVGSVPVPAAANPLRTEGLVGADRLRVAAMEGNLSAITEIGTRFAEGRNAPRDMRAAVAWLQKAADQGFAPAQYRLAGLYREGRGIERDNRRAFALFEQAAGVGHVRAMHNAGVLLAEGVKGSPDYAGAGEWFRKASEHGTRDSQYNLAILHARGLGVAQDLEASYHWFAAAARAGDEDAGKKRDEVAARLPADRLAEARAKAQAWKPQPANPAVNDIQVPTGGWEGVAAPARPAAPAVTAPRSRATTGT